MGREVSDFNPTRSPVGERPPPRLRNAAAAEPTSLTTGGRAVDRPLVHAALAAALVVRHADRDRTLTGAAPSVRRDEAQVVDAAVALARALGAHARGRGTGTVGVRTRV